VEQGRVEKSRHLDHRNLNSRATRACGRSRVLKGDDQKQQEKECA
jgi:hypothetical protein